MRLRVCVWRRGSPPQKACCSRGGGVWTWGGTHAAPHADCPPSSLLAGHAGLHHAWLPLQTPARPRSHSPPPRDPCTPNRLIAGFINPLSQRQLGCNAELVVDEFGVKLLEELDYVQEARNVEVGVDPPVSLPFLVFCVEVSPGGREEWEGRVV